MYDFHKIEKIDNSNVFFITISNVFLEFIYSKIRTLYFEIHFFRNILKIYDFHKIEKIDNSNVFLITISYVFLEFIYSKIRILYSKIHFFEIF
jgi:hypothetical protein